MDKSGHFTTKLRHDVKNWSEAKAHLEKRADLVETSLFSSFFLVWGKFREITSNSSFPQGKQTFLQIGKILTSLDLA